MAWDTRGEPVDGLEDGETIPEFITRTLITVLELSSVIVEGYGGEVLSMTVPDPAERTKLAIRAAESGMTMAELVDVVIRAAIIELREQSQLGPAQQTP